MYYCTMYSKELLKGTIDMIILRLLSEHGRMYGYEICQKVKELTGGKILLKDGSLYPALHKMLVDGTVTTEEVSIGKRVRKYYTLTQKGNEAKKEKVSQLMDFLKTIESIMFEPDSKPASA
ncbi:helix-turn-helix transcriptional regulator [uncultured Imperialibacter sp.]|uniref:PadR family transcriptional regulator n=1 Tax=uncultured Imperialibacter sp. TaxID=1672639 RepID=UPI0030D8DCBA